MRLFLGTYRQFEDKRGGISRTREIEKRIRLVDTIGNLTLLTNHLNSNVRNGPFSAKRSALNEHPLLVMNREISKEKEWG